MTQHNITGSEAHLPSSHIEIRHGRHRRRMHPALKIHLLVAGVGVVASLVDTVIGAPVCLTLICCGFLALWLTAGN